MERKAKQVSLKDAGIIKAAGSRRLLVKVSYFQKIHGLPVSFPVLVNTWGLLFIQGWIKKPPCLHDIWLASASEIGQGLQLGKPAASSTAQRQMQIGNGKCRKRETGSFMQRRLIKGSVVVHYDGGHPELARCVHISSMYTFIVYPVSLFVFDCHRRLCTLCVDSGGLLLKPLLSHYIFL